MELNNFPFPISVNHIHIPSGRFRRRNSPQYVAFKHECLVYKQVNRASLKSLALWAKDKKLSVHFSFYSPQERLFCKDGSVKRFDHHNLFKTACDALAEMLEIDDRMFFEVSATKIVGTKNYADISIREYV